MSHDQKPARLRVVSSGATTAGRRRGDDQTIIEHAGGAAASSTTLPQAGTRKSPVMLSMIFILGCAAGAIGLTLSGMI